MDKVFDNTGPTTSNEVRPVRVGVEPPSVSAVVPIVKSSEDMMVEFAEKLAGLKLVFSKSVICPNASIEMFLG